MSGRAEKSYSQDMANRVLAERIRKVRSRVRLSYASKVVSGLNKVALVA